MRELHEIVRYCSPFQALRSKIGLKTHHKHDVATHAAAELHVNN